MYCSVAKAAAADCTRLAVRRLDYQPGTGRNLPEGCNVAAGCGGQPGASSRVSFGEAKASQELKAATEQWPRNNAEAVAMQLGMPVAFVGPPVSNDVAAAAI